MDLDEKININLTYSPCKLKTFSFGNYLSNTDPEIELFITGSNESKTKSFLHYLTRNLSSNSISNTVQKKEKTFLFQTWNYTPSKIINSIIPIKLNQQNNNNNLSDGAFLFSSQLELLLLNNNNNNNNNNNIYLVDNELYKKPLIEKDLIYGLISDIGLKIFDLNKKETKSILYPGKKHIINDYLCTNDNKNIIFFCEDKKIYLYDKTDEKSFISRSHKMELNLICEASDDGKKFYAYSDGENCLYLYDIRNINHYIEITKRNVEIIKMIYNKLFNRLFFLEFCSQGIISLDNLKQESIYELDKDIEDFGFQLENKLMNIILEDNSVNIINIQ